ncbi:MAG: sel1 repeat family protein [Alphaproteobacteria bacterium]|nr:sel1 repeat family protein [Alphaproteobacteria bacterium]
MLRSTPSLVLAALLILAPIAASLAQDYEAGVKAYNRGDYSAALKHWKPLADKGNAQAQHYLGLMYTQGFGLPKDHAKAVAWFKKAAQAGHIPAAYNLGFRYLRGEGVRQNAKAGAHWIRRAAGAGLVPAQHTLGLLYANGDGVPRDYVQAYLWLSLSANRKNRIAEKDRDTIAKRMTVDQLRRAKALVAKWQPDPPR